MDSLQLRAVVCRCRIGVPASERKNRQKILVDVKLELSLTRAGKSDDVKHVPDYFSLEKRLRKKAEEGERKLLEKLAEDLAGVTLKFDRRIRAVTIRARKSPAAMPKIRDVVVEIRRRNNRKPGVPKNG